MTSPITRRPVRAACAASLALACLLPAAGCRGQSDPPAPPAAALPPPPPATAASEAEQLPLQARTEEVDAASRDRARLVTEQQKDLARARVEFEANSEQLTPEQRQLLADRIGKERGSMRNLLQEILDQDAKIRELSTRLASMGEGLPASHVVTEGDRHDRIAMDYLIAQGVSAQAAYQVVSKLNLDESLLPGFRVWTYYNKGQFGTWVTQGTANISPVERRRRLTEEVALLRDEVKASQAVATKLKEQNEVLSTEVAGAMAAAQREREARAASEAQANSVAYVIGTKKGLEKQGLIDGRLTLRRFDLPESQSLNLTTTQTLTFDPSSYSPPVKKVKRVRVAPTDFVDGVDYSVSAPDVAMQLRILNPDKFKKVGRFVVVIE